ncbi:CLUMA_CG004109, isoform A [Clunio marinus]|uniref:CLUMA_CG004109, isoform A n=1 Tax=Clunio marinus TaxID=568069 RepID=A0A1J1HS05_9DIPT|nr:CLUMA_CG004109, isoform A [Clunio marinus]
MGEEVSQSNNVLKSSAGSDETDKAAPAVTDECETINSNEKSEIENTNNNIECEPQSNNEKILKKVSISKHQENSSIEKSRKWYNIGFMHRAGISSNFRSANTTDNRNAVKMDNRHSWHLNDSTEIRRRRKRRTQMASSIPISILKLHEDINFNFGYDYSGTEFYFSCSTSTNVTEF